jgi:hypothetical protein
MTEDENRAKHAHPVLLCFDGSNDAAAAITKAGELLVSLTAVVLTVWEPAALWEPYDPATILTAPMSRLASKELGLDEIASQAARETSDRGVALARTAGFEVRGSVAKGKSWRAICDEAEAGRRADRGRCPRPVACPVGAPGQRVFCRRRARAPPSARHPGPLKVSRAQTGLALSAVLACQEPDSRIEGHRAAPPGPSAQGSAGRRLTQHPRRGSAS